MCMHTYRDCTWLFGELAGADPGGGGLWGCNPPKALGNQRKIKQQRSAGARLVSSSRAISDIHTYFSTRARATCAIGIGGARGKRSCARARCRINDWWQHQSDFSNGQGVRECHVSRWSRIITAVFQGI